MRHVACPLESEAACDDVSLNLRRASAQRGETRIPEETLHRVFHAVAIAAENLHTEVRYGLVGLAGVELEYCRVVTRCLALRHQPGKSVDQGARHIEHDLHVGQLVRDRLKLPDGPPELPALLCVVQGILEGS